MESDEYGGWKGAHNHPDLFTVEEACRRDLERMRAHRATPWAIEQERIKAEGKAARQAAKNAGRKRSKFVQTTDYPWLKPGWEW